MKEEKRKWHVHVIVAERMTESQFTELKTVSSAAFDALEDGIAFAAGVISRESRKTYAGEGFHDKPFVIPEAVHFNVELANVEEGRPL